jgi:hypothetical protein
MAPSPRRARPSWKSRSALLAAEAKPKAKVIDPTAESTTVALNINDMANFADNWTLSPPMW